MSVAFPALQQKHAAFLSSVEEATLQDLLGHLHLVNHELRDGYSGDEPLREVVDYLKTAGDGDVCLRLCQEIEAVEALIAEHGDRRLK